MSAAVQMEHHADEWFSRSAFSMLTSGRRFFDKTRGLEGFFDKGVAAGDAVMGSELFMEVSDIEIAICRSVQTQDCLKLLKRNSFWAWRFHAPVEDTVIAVFFISCFPAFHGPVRDPDNVSGLSPVDLPGNGL